MYNGASSNISMEEIYSINYNDSIVRLGTPAYPFIFEVNVITVFGLDGKQREAGSKLIKLPQLSSPVEVCFSFDFLQDKGAKSYKFSLKMFANSTPSFKGFMSLPNQTRSFDRFQLFKVLTLPDEKTTSIAYSVYSLKFLEKRNTATEPCVSVENYDKVLLITALCSVNLKVLEIIKLFCVFVEKFIHNLICRRVCGIIFI